MRVIDCGLPRPKGLAMTEEKEDDCFAVACNGRKERKRDDRK